MGAWGGLVIFDFEKYKTKIIPALKAGNEHPLVKAEIIKINYHDRNLNRSPTFEGLETLIHTFDYNLTKTSIGKKFLVCDGSLILEPGNGAYKNQNCWDYWDLVRLFELILTRNCFEFVTNFGQRNNCIDYITHIEDDIGRELIKTISTRGNYWRHSGGGWNEGIHGWLDTEESKLFALIVDQIEPHENYLDDKQLPSRLHALKIMVKEAAKKNKGLVWGADLNILYSIDWKKSKVDSIIKVDTKITECLNSIKSAEGEIVIF